MTRFAIVTRDELWSRGRLLERRLGHGEAVEDALGIVATDACDDALLATCDAVMEELRRCVLPDVQMRLVAEASTDGVTQTIVLTANGRSLLTDPAHLASDLALLQRPHAAPASRTLLFTHGSAAVLLHEISGHALEHGQPPVALPSWLAVDVALRMRRATFRDVPLLRMEHVRVTQTSAPFDLQEHAEVALVDHGAYDPATEVVTLQIGRTRLRANRHEIRFLGARGEPQRYPGVICSREGQELVVASSAPEVLVEWP